MVDTDEVRARHRRIHKYAGNGPETHYVECECGAPLVIGQYCDVHLLSDEVDRLRATAARIELAATDDYQRGYADGYDNGLDDGPRT